MALLLAYFTSLLFISSVAAASYNSIAVFGGSGKTGSECVYQALKSGNKVYVLARDPSKLLIPKGSGGEEAGQLLVNPMLTVLQGSVTDPYSVNSLFDAASASNTPIDGVIVALGGRTKNVGPTMLTDGTKCIIDAMKIAKVKRVAVVTSIGTGDSIDQAPFKFRMLMWTVMRSIMADKNNQEELFLKEDGPGNDLDYVIVRPGQLGEGPPTGVVNVVEGQAGYESDMAKFLLSAVTESSFPYLRRTPCLSSTGGIGWTKEDKEGFDKATTL